MRQPITNATARMRAIVHTLFPRARICAARVTVAPASVQGYQLLQGSMRDKRLETHVARGGLPFLTEARGLCHRIEENRKD